MAGAATASGASGSGGSGAIALDSAAAVGTMATLSHLRAPASMASIGARAASSGPLPHAAMATGVHSAYAALPENDCSVSQMCCGMQAGNCCLELLREPNTREI